MYKNSLYVNKRKPSVIKQYSPFLNPTVLPLLYCCWLAHQQLLQLAGNQLLAAAVSPRCPHVVLPRGRTRFAELSAGWALHRVGLAAPANFKNS